ncbi:MAG: cytochrome c3 family protein [Deltaproteobacteria bacterium]|nr:cytochrome c3 family protein [Deltaproteobacteria bacterium]
MALIFPKWTNDVPKKGLAALTIGTIAGTLLVWFYFSPKHTDVGYMPTQPIPYSHKLHVGDLGMDCRYCHTAVEKSPAAGVPAAQICLNCHNMVKADSPKLKPLHDLKIDGKLTFESKSVEWLRIHKIPDYAYFDHSAHVTQGVGCKSCHGRVDKMEVVKQTEPLSMSWCLDCHNDVRHFEKRGFNPAEVLRPGSVSITDMTWDSNHKEFSSWTTGAKAKASKLMPPTVECSECHR